MKVECRGSPVFPPAGLFAWLEWALFGNDDDGIYGDLNWNPQQEQTLGRRVLWWLRNPCHNLTFYVIGCAGVDSTREGPFPLDVFRPGGGLNWAVTRTESGGWYPFVSWWRAGSADKFYIGWRERGNFGIKLTGLPMVALVAVLAWRIVRHVA